MGFAVLQDLVQFGFAYYSVDDIRRTERHVEVGKIVLVQEGGVERGNHDVVNADEIVLQHQTMMWLLADGNGTRRRGGILLGKIGGRSLSVSGGGEEERAD